MYLKSVLPFLVFNYLVLTASNVTCITIHRWKANKHKNNKRLRLRSSDKPCIEDFRETTTNYPTKRVNQLLEKHKEELKEFESVNDLKITFRAPDQREQYNNMCKTDRKVIFPTYIQNFIIVQQPKKLEQGIEILRCKVNAKCWGAEHLPDNYTTECQNISVKVKFLIYDEELGILRHHLINVPAGCACTYRKKLNTTSIVSKKKFKCKSLPV